jgi:hypothetical protein
MARLIKGVRFEKSQPEPRRRIKVKQTDELEICGFIVDAEILAAVLDPENRVLWSFIGDGEGRVQPVPVQEEMCIWLLPSDLVRTAKDEVQYVGAVKKRAAKK